MQTGLTCVELQYESIFIELIFNIGTYLQELKNMQDVSCYRQNDQKQNKAKLYRHRTKMQFVIKFDVKW